MPKKTPQEVLSNWKNTWDLSNDSAVAVSPAAFNLAINMLHLIWQRFLLLFFMASSGGRLKLANVFSFLFTSKETEAFFCRFCDTVYQGTIHETKAGVILTLDVLAFSY